MAKSFKALLMAVALFAGFGTAHADGGDNAAGVDIAYGTDVNMVGIALKYQHYFSDNLRIQPSFTYYFEKDKSNMYSLDLDAHYLFNFAEKHNVYPIFGFTLLDVHWKDFCEGKTNSEGDLKYDSHNHLRFGVNVGAGYQFDITDDFSVNLNAKYQIVSTHGQFVIGVGCAVKF